MSSSQKIEELCKMLAANPAIVGLLAEVVNAGSSAVAGDVDASQQEFFDAGSGPGLGVCEDVVVVASSGGRDVGVEDDHFGSVSDASDSGGSVEMPVRAIDRTAVGRVNFLADVAPDEKFFKKCVATANVKKLEQRLRKLGIGRFKGKLQELALVTYAAGVMPSGFVDGRARLQNASLMGDAVAKFLVVEEMVGEHRSAAEINKVVTSALTRIALTAVCVNSGYADFVSVPTQVNLDTGAVAGEHLEALIGVVYYVHGLTATKLLMCELGLLKGV